MIAALQTVAPGRRRERAVAPRVAPSRPIEAVLAPLLNELNARADDIVLVLDDYHAIDAPEIQDGMAFLLDHLPAHVHLVIATRADPALPLARLRARGELVEIRAADLRFTPDEADAYLNGVMGAGAHGAATSPRWRAGPRAGSPRSSWRGCRCRGETTSPASSPASPGDDRYIVDYLVEEVLAASARRMSGASCCRPRSWPA